MITLPIFLDLRNRPVILVGDGEAAEAKRRLIERAGARVVGEEDDAALAIVAVAEPEPIVARLRVRGLLINVVDRPELGDFLMPAIVDRDPVVIAIGTGGVSAGLAAALRQRLETELPANLGRLAEALRAARPALAARLPDPADRRRALSALLASGDFPETADEIVERAAAAPARVERLVIRSADPDELTLRAARLLGIAERLYHPAALPSVILDRARADALRIVGTAPALLEPGLTVELVWMPE